MTEKQRNEAIKYINSQIEDGYLDLGLYDQNELEIVKEAMHTLHVVDECCKIGCTSFLLTPEEIERILSNESN